MEMGQMVNGTTMTEFILLGFGVGQQEQFQLLIFFAILYMITLTENTHLSRLPTYILLSNFSWLENYYMSTTVPRLIFDLASPQRVISFTDCFLQFYLLFSFGTTESFFWLIFDLASPQGTISFMDCFLQFYLLFSLGTTEDLFLSAMALDRYLAICHPLRYPQIMSPDFCFALVIACWGLGFTAYIIPVTMISKLSFCGPNVIDHFLCDAETGLALACPPLGVTPFVCQMLVDTFVLSKMRRQQSGKPKQTCVPAMGPTQKESMVW